MKNLPDFSLSLTTWNLIFLLSWKKVSLAFLFFLLFELLENFFQKRSSVLVYQRDKIILLSINSIALFYAQHLITHVVCSDQKTFTGNYPLEELETICGDPSFRVNRQFLINRQAVKLMRSDAEI